MFSPASGVTTRLRLLSYEMMESYWPAVARGDEAAPPAMREWAAKLEAKPKYVVSSTRKDFPWTNSHHVAGDLACPETTRNVPVQLSAD